MRIGIICIFTPKKYITNKNWVFGKIYDIGQIIINWKNSKTMRVPQNYAKVGQILAKIKKSWKKMVLYRFQQKNA